MEFQRNAEIQRLKTKPDDPADEMKYQINMSQN